jgi:hypothetical protein
VILLLLPACGQPEEGQEARGAASRYHTAADLEDIVLRPDEAPEGTEYLQDRSGELSLKELWPTACCLGVQDQFRQDGFQTAHAAVFERPGHSADPIDARPGFELVSSSAVLFLDDQGASAALDQWVDYFREPALEPVDVAGFGEEAVGLAGSPEAPAEILVLYVWRIGRLVLSLRVSAGAGTVGVADARGLAERMQDRAS